MGKKASLEELKPYFEGLRELDLHKPDFIIMACNTIHVFRKRLQRKTCSEIIDLRLEVKRLIGLKKASKICVLGTPLTVNSGLFEFEGIETIKPSAIELEAISNAVFRYNQGFGKRKQSAILKKIAEKYSKNAVLLLACTEISLMLKGLKCQKIDTMDAMVNATLRRL